MSNHENFDPVCPRFPFLWHGGDYNPDQWRHVPGTVDEDFRLFPLAGINTISISIFGWSVLEPEEGRYEFDWLDDIMERAAKNGMTVVLATPTAAKPNWMAAKYPEVRRMVSPGNECEPQRQTQHARHNHCPSSPVYRAKAVAINTLLAQRYGQHPSLAMWHVSNEYGGACHCPLCYQGFREWLQRKYGSLEKLNHAWWTGFWSHTFTDWEEITTIDESIDGMVIDWQRFVTDVTVDFYLTESQPLREITPEIPLTTNMMGYYEPLDYWRFAPHIDVASWDSYPRFHDQPGQTEHVASYTGMMHDFYRSLKKGKPFLLMESSPGPTNWQATNRLLRPGVHRMKSLQAVAHGADSVQYFQIRKGRGGSEKFHAAVIDHVGHENTRMFGEIAQVGRDLTALQPLTGSRKDAPVGLIIDWESRWALAASAGPLPELKQQIETSQVHYHPWWKRGIGVDILNGDADLSGYQVIVAPTLYLLRDGFAERIEEFVAAGGTFIATYLTGIVNEQGLCFRGGWPGPLRKLLGIWAEEIDYLYDNESNRLLSVADNTVGLEGEFGVSTVCDLIHAETAEVLARYERDFYAGRPAVTCNRFGKGQAWYIAARDNGDLLEAAYGLIARHHGLGGTLKGQLPEGVATQQRRNANGEFLFVFNFANEPREVDFGSEVRKDLLSGKELSGSHSLKPYDVIVLHTA